MHDERRLLFDPTVYRVEVSDPRQQVEAGKDRALGGAGHVLVEFVRRLALLGQLAAAHVEPWSVTISTPRGQRITVSISLALPAERGRP